MTDATGLASPTVQAQRRIYFSLPLTYFLKISVQRPILTLTGHCDSSRILGASRRKILSVERNVLLEEQMLHSLSINPSQRSSFRAVLVTAIADRVPIQ